MLKTSAVDDNNFEVPHTQEKIVAEEYGMQCTKGKTFMTGKVHVEKGTS